MVCSAIGVTTGVAAVITIAKPFAQSSDATGSALQSVEEFIIVLFIEEQLLDIGEDDTTSTDDVILKTTILRSKLADKLPAAFVPAVILPVKQIPRTTAGKIDRPQLLKVFSSSVVDGTNETDAVKGASAVSSEDVLDVTNIDQAEDSLPSVMFRLFNYIKHCFPTSVASVRALLQELVEVISQNSQQYRTHVSDMDPKFGLITRHNLMALGVDSVTAIELVWRVKQTFGVSVSAVHVRSFSLLALALEISRLREADSCVPSADTQTETKVGTVAAASSALTPTSVVVDSNVLIQLPPLGQLAFHKSRWPLDFMGPTGQSLTYTNNPVIQMQLRPRWSSKLARCVDSAVLFLQFSPSSDGTESVELILIGSHGGDFHCLRAADGETMWTTNLRQHIEGSAVASSEADSVFVPSYRGQDVDGLDSSAIPDQHGIMMGSIWKLRLLDGSVMWRCPLPGEVKTTPIVHRTSNSLVVGCYDGCVHMISCVHGDIWHSFQLHGSVFSIPALNPVESEIFAATTQGAVYRLAVPNRTSQHTISEHDCLVEIGAPVFSSIVLLSDLNNDAALSGPPKQKRSKTIQPSALVFGSVDGKAVSMDLNGTVVRVMEATKPVFCTPIVCYVEATNEGSDRHHIIFGSHDGFLRCYALAEQDESQLLWECDCEAAIFATPAVVEAAVDARVLAVAVATTAGELLCVDSVSGSILCKYRLDGEIYSSPVFVKPTNARAAEYDNSYLGSVYVGCRDDKVHCVDLFL
jgi:outer membrane protein assembly factor BamB/acyl carrier protein